jgi:hypothetical protein
MPFIKKGTGAPRPKQKSKTLMPESSEQSEPKFKQASHERESTLQKVNPSYKVMMLHHH